MTFIMSAWISQKVNYYSLRYFLPTIILRYISAPILLFECENLHCRIMNFISDSKSRGLKQQGASNVNVQMVIN